MTIKFIDKWNQYGLIAELAIRLKDVSPQFGKTALQKLVYILQEVFHVPNGYSYILYNYGPYSEELAEDLMFFASMDGVKVEWQNAFGYKIQEASKTEHFKKRAMPFLAQYEKEIGKMVNDFGYKTARELELLSTIIYISKEAAIDKNDLIGRILEIKPHFSLEDIENAYDWLKANYPDALRKKS